MTQVTPRHSAYAAAQAHYFHSSQPEWGQTDAKFNNVDLFEAHPNGRFASVRLSNGGTCEFCYLSTCIANLIINISSEVFGAEAVTSFSVCTSICAAVCLCVFSRFSRIPSQLPPLHPIPISLCTLYTITLHIYMIAFPFHCCFVFS